MSTASTEQPSQSLAEMPDGLLVAEHLEGSNEAFEILYRRYNDRLVGWFVRRLDDRVLAEDLAQDTMVRALKYADSFDQDLPMWPWLKTAAYRVMVNHLDDRPDGDESLEDQYEDEGKLDLRMASMDDRPALERVMKALSERHQIALSLRYLRGWGPQDVADFFDMTTNACNQLMYRARNAARREYERLCGEIRMIVWPLLVPFASRWRSVLNRFRQSRWTSNSPHLANILPSVENAVQAAIATAAAMFVVATAVGVGQTNGPGERAATAPGAVPAGALWDFSADRPETLVGDSGTHDASTPSATSAEDPEHEGGTRRTVAVSSGDAPPVGSSDPGLVIAAETERSVDEDEDRDTFSSRIHVSIGDEAGDVVFINLYCDHSRTAEAVCDGLDDAPEPDMP